MPIRIASQPVGATILGAASTAVAETGAKRSAVQAAMLERNLDRSSVESVAAARLLAAKNEANADRKHDEELLAAKTLAEKEAEARRDAAYRTKDATEELYKAIAMRERYYHETPLTPNGMRQRDEAAASLQWIRNAQGEYPQDAINQYMAQWVNEFDRRNPQLWAASPATPWEDVLNNGLILSPEGRRISREEYDAGARVGRILYPEGNRTREIKFDDKDAQRQLNDDKVAAERLKWAQVRVRERIDSSGEKEPDKDMYDKLLREQMEEYDRLHEMSRNGTYRQGAPQAGQAQQTPQQSPVVQQPPQQFPSPTVPYQPPSQPLNAGEVTLPGGPSQLAPPPRDMAGEVAAEQEKWSNPQQIEGELNRIMDAMEKRGLKYDQLSPADKMRFDELARRYGGA